MRNTILWSIQMTRKDMAVIERKFIEKRILAIRGLRVMIDADLAEIYGSTTKKLNQAVKRNQERFPIDFLFQLSEKEKERIWP